MSKVKLKYDKDINYVVFGQKLRPWGYEVRIAIFDDNDNHVGSLCHTWPRSAGIPVMQEFNNKIKVRLEKYKEKRDNPEPEPTPMAFMTLDDVDTFLRARGYIAQNQSIADIPDLTPTTVETPPQIHYSTNSVTPW